MNALPDGLKNSAQVQLILNNVLYLVESYDVANGSSLTDLLKSVAKHIAEKRQPPLSDTELRAYEKIKAAVAQNPSLGKLTIRYQSKVMGYPTNGLNAAVFTDEAGNAFVVFRGTGDGEWIDNGFGLSGLYQHLDTGQQLEALEYFDRVMADLEANEKFAEKIANGEQFVTVSGHSKGGNKAQYVTINSEYSNLIDKCFNFDGQGFSPEAIEQFIEEKGEEAYETATNKMYGFNAENDYVNPLGIRVIPDEHMYYFDNIEDALIQNHYPDAFLDATGNFTEQKDGPGAVSRFVKALSDELMSLPPRERALSTDAVMSIMHYTMGEGEPIGGSASPLKIVLGIPGVLKTLLNTVLEGTVSSIVQPIAQALKDMGETFGNMAITIGYGFANLGVGLWDVLTSFDSQKIFEGIFKILWGVTLILYSIIETVINLIIDVINLVINIVMEIVNGIGGLVEFVGEIVGQDWGWHFDVVSPLDKLPLPDYSLFETGGFPKSGHPFIAREAGPELVGRLHGSTAVVNNTQIVEAVSIGVYGAFMSALNDTTSHSQPIARVFLDGRQIAMAG